MVVEKLKTVEGVSEGWLQEDRRECKLREQLEYSSTKGHETRCWNRTVFVPARMQPIDIVEAYSHTLPFPMFHAGIPKLNKHKVEYIASAMTDPNLRWEKMCSFSVARYQSTSMRQPEISMGGLCYNPEDYIGENVLVSGHNCFMAFLLCGLPPSELQPIRINLARHGVHQVYPWWMVFWGG